MFTAIGKTAAGGPTGIAKIPKIRRIPETAVCVWSRTSVSSAMGSKNRYVKKMNPTSAPAVSPEPEPRHSPTKTTVETAIAPKISPDGKRSAPIKVALVWASPRIFEDFFTRRPKMCPAEYACRVSAPVTNSAVDPSRCELAKRVAS